MTIAAVSDKKSFHLIEEEIIGIFNHVSYQYKMKSWKKLVLKHT